MQDWDTILKNRTRHGTFIGATRKDEDAYFAAFADEPKERKFPIFMKISLRVTDLFRSAKLG